MRITLVSDVPFVSVIVISRVVPIMKFVWQLIHLEEIVIMVVKDLDFVMLFVYFVIIVLNHCNNLNLFF